MFQKILQALPSVFLMIGPYNQELFSNPDNVALHYYH